MRLQDCDRSDRPIDTNTLGTCVLDILDLLAASGSYCEVMDRWGSGLTFWTLALFESQDTAKLPHVEGKLLWAYG